MPLDKLHNLSGPHSIYEINQIYLLFRAMEKSKRHNINKCLVQSAQKNNNDVIDFLGSQQTTLWLGHRFTCPPYTLSPGRTVEEPLSHYQRDDCHQHLLGHLLYPSNTLLIYDWSWNSAISLDSLDIPKSSPKELKNHTWLPSSLDYTSPFLL